MIQTNAPNGTFRIVMVQDRDTQNRSKRIHSDSPSAARLASSRCSDCSQAARRVRDTPLFEETKDYWRDFGRLPIPAVAQEVQARQLDKAKGLEWRGIAILLVGQVRTGTLTHVVQGFRGNVINPLREGCSPEDMHVFAALEFTKGDIRPGSRENIMEQGVAKEISTLVRWKICSGAMGQTLHWKRFQRYMKKG